MENEPELIRDQMQETRTALTDKLDTLQQKVASTVESITTPVAETVQNVKDAVTSTVDTVKDTVTDTVESVKETFDLTRQIERHPWPIFLGSVAAGYVLGRLLPSPAKVASIAAAGTSAVASGVEAAYNGHHRNDHKPSQSENPPASGGLLSGLATAFQGELDQIKGLGVSVGVGVLRDIMTQSVQGEMGTRLREWLDSLTEKLGGKPFTESLVGSEDSESSGTNGSGSTPSSTNGANKKSEENVNAGYQPSHRF